MRENLIIYSYLVYALSVKKVRTVIYPAHGLYQNINVVFAGQSVEVNALLFVVSVNNALVFLVYKYICSVGEAVKIELAAEFLDAFAYLLGLLLDIKVVIESHFEHCKTSQYIFCA